MDRVVHEGFLKDVHAQYPQDQGFIDIASLPWSDESFHLDLLYLYIKNFDAAKKATIVDSRIISLDKDILALIFKLSEG